MPTIDTINEQDFEDDDHQIDQIAMTKLLMEARDSISSIDSNISVSFDEKSLQIEDEGAHMADMSDSSSDNGSAGGGKDSGCEVTPEVSEPIFTPPTEELADKIVQQVEFYFSDANITKDAFLLKHVKRNKEGYVSLKLISSFKRVKHLTKDWRVVAHALTRSTKLEINEVGTKLRRLEPLPKYDETTPSRTIVAVHMPIEKSTIENVAELFKNCGEIALIRILRPGNPIPADVRQFINKNPSLAGVMCALVEFVHSESARNALKLQEQLGDPMKIYELNNVPHPERKKNKVAKKLSRHDSSSDFNCASSCSESEDRFKSLRLRRGSSTSSSSSSSHHFPSRYIEPAAWLQRRLSASSTEANFMHMNMRRLSYSSRDSSESNLYLPRRMSACSLSSESSSRRLSNASHSGSEFSLPTRSRSNSSAFQNFDNIVRLPKGPDGSRGFRQRLSYGTVH